MSYAGPAPKSTVRGGRKVAVRAIAVLVVLVPLGAVVAVGAVLKTSKAQLSASPTALAKVTLPFGGGTIQRVIVARAVDQRAVPVSLSRGVITPTGLVPAGERLTVDVVIRRPGWNAWLTGKTERLNLTVTAPAAKIKARYVTVNKGQPLHVRFRTPVKVVELGSTRGEVRRTVLPQPETSVTVPTSGLAGTVFVGGVPRTWETTRTALISWFPAGASATAVASPAPGTTITPLTRITLRFSKPVSQALGNSMPPVSPTTSGTWHEVDSHTITFTPTGYGYGLDASVVVGLPSGVRLLGGTESGGASQGRWSVPGGSTERLQELLAGLGYLPMTFTATGTPVQKTMAAEEVAAVHPPQGSFNWTYSNTPSDLRSEWQAGSYGELTKGAVMAFENTEGMDADGIAGPDVWKALITATIAGNVNSFGYTYVNVSEGSPETESVWHNGKTVVSGPVNTGVAAAPTATGVFAVFEHLTVTTMTGTNPDGSHYDDPGIPWVSYFNGGDALHGFIRASYGFPQSDGCVEMPYAEAQQVWPYTPIGTIVNVHA
jgi:peptidoglycan hydrolase-like protein with peptidoglycan-binding domain